MQLTTGRRSVQSKVAAVYSSTFNYLASRFNCIITKESTALQKSVGKKKSETFKLYCMSLSYTKKNLESKATSTQHIWHGCKQTWFSHNPYYWQLKIKLRVTGFLFISPFNRSVALLDMSQEHKMNISQKHKSKMVQLYLVICSYDEILRFKRRQQ